MLTVIIALMLVLAGCTGGQQTGTPGTEATEQATPAPTATPSPTASPTPTPVPALVAFEYPPGADRAGLDGAAISDSHENVLPAEGSVRVRTEYEQSSGMGSFSSVTTTTVSGDGVYRVEEPDRGPTTDQWAPAGGTSAYYRQSSGFETAFYVNDDGIGTEAATETHTVRSLLAAVEWSEATEVANISGTPAARYVSTGIASEERLGNLVYADEVQSFNASVAVTEAGYVRQFHYRATVERRGEEVTIEQTTTYTDRGTAVVEPPEWLATAEEEGLAASSSLVDDGQYLRLEIENGKAPQGTDLSVSSGGHHRGKLPADVAAGDVVYLSVGQPGQLVVGVDEKPDEANGFSQPFVLVQFRSNGLTTYEDRLSSR